MPKLVFTSDLHQRGVSLPPHGDILINCGDMTFQGTAKEVKWTHEWLAYQKTQFKDVVFVLGNHDFRGEVWGPILAEETGAIYLENSGAVVQGLKIWGSPYTPRFGSWHFMEQRGPAIRKIWEQIPEGLDILITHGPPYGILDWVPYRGGENVGCWDLLDIVKQRKPKIHVFGHIHCGAEQTGTEGLGVTKEHGITFINAAVCNEDYQPDNSIKTIEV